MEGAITSCWQETAGVKSGTGIINVHHSLFQEAFEEALCKIKRSCVLYADVMTETTAN
jgi:hypothetical protein